MTQRLRPALQVVLHDLLEEVTPDDLAEPELLTVIAILTAARDRIAGIPGAPAVAARLEVVASPETAQPVEKFSG